MRLQLRLHAFQYGEHVDRGQFTAHPVQVVMDMISEGCAAGEGQQRAGQLRPTASDAKLCSADDAPAARIPCGVERIEAALPIAVSLS